jgi:hypothetical protein
MFLKGRFSLAALGLICIGVSSAYATPVTLCYFWADQPSPTIGVPYTPNTSYSYNGKKKANSVTKTSTGAYTVVCTGEGGSKDGGHVQVTAYGSLDAFCHVVSWHNSADLTAEVDCFSLGAPADNSFDFLYLK